MLVKHIPEALAKMDDWLNELAPHAGKPVRVPVDGNDFVWRYPESSPEVVLVAKLARLASAMSGAWRLADAGQTTEAGSLLRLVDDFSSEVWFVADIVITGASNKAQRKFIADFFKPMARSVQEFLDREKAHWVSRGDIMKKLAAMADEAGQDKELQSAVSKYLNYSLNGYAHAAYQTAMEMYHGGRERFEVLGSGEGRATDSSREFAAAKCTEAVLAVGIAATAFRRQDLVTEIQNFLAKVDPSMG